MLRMDERNQRWDQFLKQRNIGDEKEASRSENEIILSKIFQEIIIENFISIEITETTDFPELYRQVEQSLPIEWFISPGNDFSHNYYEEFSVCPVLQPISERAMRKIWADTPRTFELFSRKSEEIAKILSSNETLTLFRTILCRILCTSSILLGGWYCQGMAFLAGSCMFYFREFRTGDLNSISQQRLGIYACGLFHFCLMKENHIEALYRNSVLLSAYMNELAYQLTNYPVTAHVYNHMASIGFTVHYFALEWFTACFLLNVSHDASLLIHDILIYGTPERKNDLLIKMGISIISSLSPRLLEYSCKSFFLFFF
jgi:hypothetical protein